MGLDFNKRACDGGYSSACNSAGIAFYRGKSGVEVNFGEAVKYFKKACDSGIAMGCNNLGSTYEKGGKGISEDINMALKYYTQACDDDLASACNSLGAIYFIGKKMPQNKNEGRKYMKKACDLDKNECGFYNAAK